MWLDDDKPRPQFGSLRSALQLYYPAAEAASETFGSDVKGPEGHQSMLVTFTGLMKVTSASLL